MRLPLFKLRGKPSVFSVSDMNRLVAAVNALLSMTIVRSNRNNLTVVEGGSILEVAGGTSEAPPIVPSLAKEYRLKSVSDDYVTAQYWNGTSDSGVNVYIAKEFRVRTSLAGEPGFTYTYGAGPDSDNKQRTKTDTGDNSTESQLVTPKWLVNEIIYALDAQTTVAKPGGGYCNLVMTSSKAWAKI